MSLSILADRLRNLVGHGNLKIEADSDGTAYNEYVLTEKGRGLFPVIVSLRQWGEAFLFQRGEPHLVLVDRFKGKPIRGLEIKSGDGRTLGPDDTSVRKLNSGE